MLYGPNPYTYQLSANSNSIVRSDGATIPVDIANSDYLDYLSWIEAGNTVTPAVQESLAVLQAQLSDQIDNIVADIYSQWTRFQQEYLLREAAAQAFADGGYKGDPGIWVDAYAVAASIDNVSATKNILAQATALNGALQALAAQRMNKYKVLAATTNADAMAAYQAVVADIESIASQIS